VDTFNNLTFGELSRTSLKHFIENSNTGQWQRDITLEQILKSVDNNVVMSFKFSGMCDGLPNAKLTIFDCGNGTWNVPNIIPTDVLELSVYQYNKILADFEQTIIEPIKVIDKNITLNKNGELNGN